MEQFLFFKENAYLNLFENFNDSRLQISNQFRVKLLCVSNLYGYAVAAFKNKVKIIPIAQFEKQSENNEEKFSSNYETIGIINYTETYQVASVQLNNLETHLIVLTYKQNDNEFSLHIYDLQSISFDASNNQQIPHCVNTINLKKDNSYVTDMSMCPVEPDQVLITKSNGEIVLITKIETNPEIITKTSEATATCWSMKGKTILACTSQNRILSYNHQDLKQKNCYNCPNKQLIGTFMKSVSTKRFEIGYDLVENDRIEPVFTLTDLNIDKNTQKENVVQNYYQSNFVYALDGDYVPKKSAFYTSFINEWNLFLCAYSKCPDLCHLSKQGDSFKELDIENYRCSLPLNSQDEEMFPLGFAVSFNIKNQIEFDTYGTQPASPLVLILTDCGHLTTFFVINRQSNQTICYDYKKMSFKNYKLVLSKAQPQPQPTPPSTSTSSSSLTNNFFQMQSSTSLFNFNGSNVPPPQQQHQSLIQSSSTSQIAFPTSQSAFNLNIPNSQNVSLSFNKTTTQQQQQQQQQIPPLPSLPSLPQSQPKQQQQQQTNLVALNVSLPIVQPVLNMQQQQQQIAKPSQQQIPIPKMLQFQKQAPEENFMSTNERIKSFTNQLEDFKQSVNKLFSGKDLTKCLLNLSVIKDTKMTEERFKKLKDETQQLSEESSNLLNKILSGFHDYENYKLQVKKLHDSKGNNININADLDPHWKNKFDNIKKLYFYLQNELPNMDEHIRESSKKRRDKLSTARPLHEVYETIRLNNINIKYRDNQLNKIIEQLKYAKLGRTIFKDISLNLQTASGVAGNISMKSKTALLNEEEGNEENFHSKNLSSLEKSRLEDSELINQISQIKIKDDTHLDLEEQQAQLKLNSERNSKLNAKLYKMLSVRKKVPVYELNLRKIEFLESKFDEAKSTQINLNETSFLNLKTQQSPLPNRAVMFSSVINESTNQQYNSPNQKPIQFNTISNNNNNSVQQSPVMKPQLTAQTQEPQIKPQIQFQQQQQQQKQQQLKPQQSAEKPKEQNIGLLPLTIQQQTKPNILTSSPLPTPNQVTQQQQQQQFSFGGQSSATTTTQKLESTSLFPSLGDSNKPKLNLGPSQITSNPILSFSSGNKPDQSLFNNQPGSASAFSFNLGNSGNSQTTPQKQPLQPQSQPQPTQNTQSQVKNEPQTPPQKSSQQQQQQMPPQSKLNIENIIKQNVGSSLSDTSKSNELNKTITISKKEENIPESTSTSSSLSSLETKKTIEINKESTPSIESSTPTSLSASQSTEQIKSFPSIPSSSSSLSSLLSMPAGSSKSGTTPFSFGLGQNSNNNNAAQIKSSFSFSSSTNSQPPVQTTPTSTANPTPNPVPTPTPTPTVVVETQSPATPIAATANTQQQQQQQQQPQQPAPSTPSAPASTPFSLFNNQLNKQTTATTSFSFGSGPKPTTSTPNHTTIAPTTTTTSQVTGTSLFSTFMPQTATTTTATIAATPTVVNPFTAAVTAQTTPLKPANQLDADMESNAMGAAQSFGTLGFGTASVKTAEEQNKNVFGGSLFGTNANTAQQQKSPFGGGGVGGSGSTGILKNPTFVTAQAPQSAGFFGGSNIAPNTTSNNTAGTSLFGSAAQSSTGGGGLFSSFKTPQKTGFGAPPAFGAAPAFGATPNFGGGATTSAFGNPPVFGSSVTSPTSSTTTSTFGSGSSLFGGGISNSATTFDSLASNNKPFGGGVGTANSGSTFGTFGQNTNNQIGFGSLAQQAQQQPQQSLFSSFGGGVQQQQQQQQPQGGFTNPTSSSFTTYRK